MSMRLVAPALLVTCAILLCGRMAGGQVAEQIPAPFDSYGAINSEDASARLDSFAIHLQDAPDVIGFIVCYGPEGEGSGTGKSILRVTKSYLVDSRGIEPDRIQTIYAGRYKDPTDVLSQLWLVPFGASPPEAKHYSRKLKKINGKFSEGNGWDGFADGAGGPSLGNVGLAAYADALRQQPNSVAYIVASNLRGATPGTWRRVANREVTDLQDYGIQPDRVKVIYGGTLKPEKDEDPQQAKLQFWILPSDARPPIKEAKPEPAPSEAVQIGSYSDYQLKFPKDERWIFEGFADVLRADERLRVCIIVWDEIPSGEKYVLPDEPPDVDEAKLVQKWKSELRDKLRIGENRIVIIHAGADEFKGGTVEVWVVPIGASLPDPYASDEEPAPDEPQHQPCSAAYTLADC